MKQKLEREQSLVVRGLGVLQLTRKLVDLVNHAHHLRPVRAGAALAAVFGEHGSLRRGCRAGGLTCACPAATLAGCAGVTLRWASLRRDFAGNSVTTKEGSQ